LSRSGRDLAAPAGRNRPWDAGVSQVGEKLARARQWLDILRDSVKGGGVEVAKALNPLGINMISGLAQEHAAEQATAHSDLAVDSPDRKIDPFRRQRFAPCQHVLVDAIDKRTVEIEQE
jgi:hypothetical protein